jgi:hypothetical protein
MRGAAVLVLALVLAPSIADAQSPAELIAQGVALREDGRDEEALAMFEQAYQDSGSGESLAQVALAEQALGRSVEAEAHLVSALAESSDRFVRRNRAALQQALDELRAGIGDLEIHGGTPGAEVWIGDVSRGLLPLAGPIRVPLGTVRIEIRSAGAATEEAEVEVTPGVVAQVELAAAPALVRVVEPVVVAEPEPEPEPEAPPPPAASVLLPIGIATAAVGVVLVGVASGMMVVREDAAHARLTCSDTDPACRAQFQTAVDAETAGVALYVVGGALAVGGAVLIALDVLGGASDRSTAFVCAPGVLSVACAARF